MNLSAQVRIGHNVLFLMQMFTTLAFSILYSTLILYATQGLHLESPHAIALTSGFIALNFALHVLGGYLCGRLLSYRGLFIVGMFLQSIGCLIISIPTLQSFILGMAIFLSSCGLNVICINCILTQMFEAHDKRRESAFLWNHSGLNLGFIIGFTISGFFQLYKNFHSLFLFATFGSLISLLITILNWKYLADQGTLYSCSKNRIQRGILTGLIFIGLIIILPFLLNHVNLTNEMVCLAGIVVALLFVYFYWKEPALEISKKIKAFFILGLSSLIFWTLYQMAPMGLTLFFQHNVNRFFFGYTIPPQWIININPVVIVFGGPLLAMINQSFRKKGYNISIPFQFTTALFLIGVGFLLPPIGIYLADSKGYSAIGWIIGSYVLQSVGELFISPIGFAMVGQLIPSRLQGLAMGTWYMVAGVAATLSNYFSQTAIGSSNAIDPLITNPSYSSSFLKLAICSIAGSAVLFFLRPLLHKLIQETTPSHSTELRNYNASYK
ncbi:MAG: dtpA 1 [Parachlamydiales bacterium]|nr:dtpA 1 [Parachlamydiales bacterium]